MLVYSQDPQRALSNLLLAAVLPSPLHYHAYSILQGFCCFAHV